MKSKRWDCHEHKKEMNVSVAGTVYHPEYGQLCYMERHHDCILSHPIVFPSLADAQKWINEGTIADLQLAFRCLEIGFNRACYQGR